MGDRPVTRVTVCWNHSRQIRRSLCLNEGQLHLGRRPERIRRPAVIGVLWGAPATVGIEQVGVTNTRLIITPGDDPTTPDAVGCSSRA